MLAGTREDALWCALGANRAHGQRLSAAHKKRAIQSGARDLVGQEPAADRKADRMLPGLCEHIRAQVIGSNRLADRTIGKDGTSYPARRNIPEAAAGQGNDATDGVLDRNGDRGRRGPRAGASRDPEAG